MICGQIPIYVISLSRTPERRLHIQRQLDALGLKYCFVDVDTIDKYELKSKTHRNRIAKLLDIDEAALERKYDAVISNAKNERQKNSYSGYIATTLSHIQIYNSMIKNDIAVACILEDDATLLPTFPEILKTAAALEWDILMLASQPFYYNKNLLLLNYIKRIRIFNKDLLFIHKKIKNCNAAMEQKRRLERLLKEYGIDARLRPEQSEVFVKALQEYDAKYAEIIKTIALSKRRLSLMKPKQYIIYRTLRRLINLYTFIQLGALPDKHSLELITKHHCIAKPRTCPVSTTAYMLKQSAAVKWKQQALAENPLAIDQIPWQLYRNKQVKLRIITPSCATATYCYLKYSTRCG